MTTLVTADEKGRIPIRGAKPGRKYMVARSGGEWRITEHTSQPAARNRREWPGHKNKTTLAAALRAMGDAGLVIERAKTAKQRNSRLKSA
jgi:hypothetical protein